MYYKKFVFPDDKKAQGYTKNDKKILTIKPNKTVSLIFENNNSNVQRVFSIQ